MKHSIKITKKGYVITVKDKKQKVVYFLYDATHSKEKYIPYILKHCEFTLGEPFGDIYDIYPLYIKKGVIEKLTSPVSQIAQHIKMSAIWKYYRSFITEDTSPKLVKQYANEFKSNLSLLGLDGLYEFVQAQALVLY